MSTQLKDLIFKDIKWTGVQFNANKTYSLEYKTSILNSIKRILTTRLGERVMLPEFGSDLYKLRDRDFNGIWRVKATQYIFEAISKWEPRVVFKQLHFNIDAITGRHNFYLELEPNV